ncbi:MAG: chromosome segregation protein SMC [Deltaproteobacteria bacterium CG11_big_fil_rev_8_21_14_0_20_45_16]|nr:MAG: chromosome segregation protein SMC [Deltaproteobacteria bacterium CG11_big_fil_rev_8_21_14_0_20_45_16]
MQGFKSFADRTELVFEHQIVGVVGPNGCGKSNIVDAIRWAMGEQSAKGLRGKDMTDVIFAGTPSRKSAGFAEVSLVFDNTLRQAPAPYTECSEVMITRRLYRTGESEYLINNVQARLKDVNDMFLGTGSSAKAYSIVAQGKVDQVVLAKPEDRRFLIEEAAGIAKYKIRKQSAERKIETTKLNLERVHDILGELERNARHFEKQVEKAEKFRELQRELRQLDERVFSAKLRKIDQKAVANESEFSGQQIDHQEVASKLQQIEASLEELRLQSLNIEKATNTDYERLFQKKENLAQLSTEYELGQQKSQLLRNQIEERKKDLDRIQSKYKDQESMKKELAQRLTQLETEKQTREGRGTELKARLALSDKNLSQKQELVESGLASLSERRTTIERQKQHLEYVQAERVEFEMKRAETERLFDGAQKALQQSLSELQAFKDLETRMKLDIKEREEALTRANRDIELVGQEHAHLLSERYEFQAKISEISSQLESLKSLEEHQVGYESGAIAFREKNNIPLLMDSIRFKSEYRKLGELLLEEIGQSFVLADQSFEAVDQRWTQILLTEASSSFESNLLLTVDSCDNESLRKLLQSIELVDELPDGSFVAHAQMDHQGNLRIPFSKGIIRESRGEIDRNQSPFSRHQEVEDLERQRQEVELSLHEIEAKIAGNLEQQSGLRLKQQDLEIKIVELKVQIDSLQSQISGAREISAKAEANVERYRTQMAELDAVIQEREQQLLEMQVDEDLSALENSLAQAKEALKLVQVEKQNLDQEWIEYRIESGAVQERYDRVRQQLVDVDMTQLEYSHNQGMYQGDIQAWVDEIENLQARSNQITTIRNELTAELGSLELQLAKSKEELGVVHRRLEEDEAQRRQLQGYKEERGDKLKQLELERQTLKFQIEELAQLLHERYQLGVQELLETVAEDLILDLLTSEEELARVETEAIKIRDRVTKFGDVNLVALQEYEEIKKRLEFMNAQKDDLLKTLDTLQSIIDRINRITEFRFRETFQAINHNFQILFPKLFGGGKAYMSLTDENDLLNTGVEIFAEPPGKKIQAMSLLSGGEKAMTSISLLFSLFAYRPSSFCILDEVDAPLDDVNTRRYNDIIREMSSLSQFIVITHNKRTMEVAQTLFGVTMQDPGCSRIVGVNLQDARAFTATA